MAIKRRTILTCLSALSFLPRVGLTAQTENTGDTEMYGLIGKMTVAEGKRDELAQILLNGISGMPGCLSYIVANDNEDENGLWITEVWEGKDAHAASLSLPSVQEAIKLGKPFIEGFGQRVETAPVGGQGIVEKQT